MQRPRLALTVLAAVAAVLSSVLVGCSSAAANPSPGPFPYGTNNCRPTAPHPYPVVLVHGTFANAQLNWSALTPYLRARGYCVYALNYGLNGTQDIHNSAKQLKTFIETFVLPNTGASRVDIVGHSQGGMMPRDYINNLGGAGKVNELVGLAPSNHGTTNPLAGNPLSCTACRQQYYTSDFLRTVNNPETQDAVDYTVIQTRYDRVVTPYTSAFLSPDDENVTNVLLQDKCPSNLDDHVGVAYDRAVFQWVDNALSRTSDPANPGFRPACY